MPMARPKPARWCSARIRRACRSRKCRSAIRIRRCELRLVDGDNRDADEGVLEMKCPAVMNGYHNRPDVTPPITADGYLHHRRRVPPRRDGFHYFVGRTDDMFVSGGENIYPADVERMLERHPGVAQAAVVPIDDDIKGQKPVAFVVPKSGAGAERGRDQALRARQRAGLPASALRLVRGRTAARVDQQGRPGLVASNGRGADRKSRRIATRQLIFRPDAFNTGVQRTSSSCTYCAASCGPEPVTGSKPARTSFCWNSRSSMICSVNPPICSMIGHGVPAGAKSPMNCCVISSG